MILLQRPDAGTIRVLDVDLQSASAQEVLELRQRFGVTFQHGGLLASLTVLENVGLPLREHCHLARAEVNELAHSKLALSGLEADVGNQYPASLSGGMMKRAALARALVLDEPTAGLDPESADGVGQRIQRLGENTLPEPERLLAELNVLSTSLRRLNKQTEHAPASLLFRKPPVRPGPGEIPPPGTTP